MTAAPQFAFLLSTRLSGSVQKRGLNLFSSAHLSSMPAYMADVEPYVGNWYRIGGGRARLDDILASKC